MTEQQRQEIKRVLQEQSSRHTAHPEEARSFLLKTGIYTSDGKLAPEYDGNEPSTDFRK